MDLKRNHSLTEARQHELMKVLQTRFEQNMFRHQGVKWTTIQTRLETNPGKLWSLHEMERTGGEPDLVKLDEPSGECVFYDCSAESPAGRRNLCYDRPALDARKENKPAGSAMEMAAAMGIALLTEEQYRELQQMKPFDTKTSSWVQTPADIRKLGGAIFMEYRYGTVFLFHNGASSYYSSRGFRGMLRI